MNCSCNYKRNTTCYIHYEKWDKYKRSKGQLEPPSKNSNNKQTDEITAYHSCRGAIDVYLY